VPTFLMECDYARMENTREGTVGGESLLLSNNALMS